MKFMKEISYLFLNTSLVLISLLPTTAYANETTSNIQLEQGGFLLKTSEPIGFGSHQIENKKKIVTTGFQQDFNVTDTRGTQEGWQVTVSATPFTIIEPITGWVQENPYSLPSGSLSLNSLTNVIGLNGENEEFYPSIDIMDRAIDMNESIKVASADTGKGMGEYALSFNNDALSLVIDPITAKIDTVNYPNTITPYESTVTWDLISGPTNLMDSSENTNINNSFRLFNNDINENIINNNDLNNNINTILNHNGLNNIDDSIGIGMGTGIENKNEQIFTYNSDTIISSMQEKTITIPNLKHIQSITDKNGGTVKVLSVNGDNVTVQVNNGYSYQELVTGEYHPSEKKEITGQLSSIYDDGQYKGTLKPYTHEIVPATTKPVSKTVYNTTRDFETIDYYTENDLMAILTNNGNPTSYLVSGSPSSSKYITDYTKDYYYDSDGYSGDLTPYKETVQGEPKYFDIYKTSQNDSFEKNIYHSEDSYSGYLELKDYSYDESISEYTANYIGYLPAMITKTLYEGYVYTPDTRVFEYMQEYTGILNIPAVTETRYQGTVIKNAVDDRKYQDIYEFNLVINYTKR